MSGPGGSGGRHSARGRRKWAQHAAGTFDSPGHKTANRLASAPGEKPTPPELLLALLAQMHYERSGHTDGRGPYDSPEPSGLTAQLLHDHFGDLQLICRQLGRSLGPTGSHRLVGADGRFEEIAQREANKGTMTSRLLSDQVHGGHLVGMAVADRAIEAPTSSGEPPHRGDE